MFGAENLHPGTEPDIVLKDQIASVQKTLWPDPDTIADHKAAIVAALQHGLIPDEHAVAEFERFGMPETHSDADLQAYATTPDKSPQAEAPHRCVQPAGGLAEPAEQLQCCRASAPGQQFGGKFRFKGRIG